MAGHRDTRVGVYVPCQLPPGTSVPRPLTHLGALFPSPGALEIGQALPIHAGRYTCTARNAVGVAHKHVVLTVRGMCPLVQTAMALRAEGTGGELEDSLGAKISPPCPPF